MDSYLLLITIGPVQGFIASARRLRDLWFGSWLLSELARTTADAVTSYGGTVTLIFPPQTMIKPGTSTLSSVANKILAQVSEPPNVIMPEVRKEVDTRLHELWDSVCKKISGPIDQKVADAQIADLLEFYWVATPLQSAKDYPQARRAVEALMSARKATRNFGPVTWGASVPKSSIDGQRESVIDEGHYPTSADSAAGRQQKVSKLYSNYKAGAAERLSAVDLLKRHGAPDDTHQSFPSSADIAVRPIMKRLKLLSQANESWRTFPQERWKAFIETIEPLTVGGLRDERVARTHPVLGNYDGGLLLESRLYELIDTHDDRKRAADALNQFFYDLNLPRPEPYYAILVADGDRMGAAIDQQQQLAQHLELSERLGQYAGKARDIVAKHDGALIYAGGDDVMAFVPLYTLIACARELHDCFGTTLNPQDSEVTFTDQDGKKPTLSMGIAICHQIDPLSDALELARATERAAKQVQDKDALAITLSKRSGADVTISGKWGELDQNLEAFVTLHRADALSDSTAYQLRDMAERLTPKGGVPPTLPAEAAYAEAQRIIGRKQPQHGTVPEPDLHVRDRLSRALKQMYVSVPDEYAALARIRALADVLIVARILASAADLADPNVQQGGT